MIRGATVIAAIRRARKNPLRTPSAKAALTFMKAKRCRAPYRRKNVERNKIIAHSNLLDRLFTTIFPTRKIEGVFSKRTIMLEEGRQKRIKVITFLRP
jgi:hypothetical protein